MGDETIKHREGQNSLMKLFVNISSEFDKVRPNSLDMLQIDTSQIEKSYGYSDYSFPNLNIGDGGSILDIPGPYYLSKSPFARYSKSVSIGLSLGSTLLGLPVNLGFGVISYEEEELIRSHRPNTIFQYTGIREESDLNGIKDCKAMEIIPDVFHLPNDKIEDNPTNIPELRKGKDLPRIVEMLKEINDVPVLIHLSASNVEKDLDRVVVSNIDGIIIHCEPSPIQKICGYFTYPPRDPISTLTEIGTHLSTFEKRGDRIKVIMDYPAFSTLDQIKLLCLGADAIALDTILERFILSNFWVSDGKKVSMEDIIRYDPDWAEIGESVQVYIEEMRCEMISACEKMRLDPKVDLKREKLRTADYSTASISGLKLAGRNKVLPIWKH